MAIFNLEPTEKDNEADFIFTGKCEVELAKVFGIDDENVHSSN